MSKTSASFNRYRLPFILLAIVIILNFSAGFYHLTHGGIGSGITELVFTAILLFTGYLVLKTYPGGRPAHLVFLLSTSILGTMALVLFGLSIYHFTHQGPRSGTVEMLMALLLALIIYFFRKPVK
ncbi:MAG: hypothetical protein NUV31_00870 [Dehalococcoidales bacterium]|jgi:FtsH-binding integral membrane protein|nr:hypothetical protein [Dehalococcoidales bacterium]